MIQTIELKPIRSHPQEFEEVERAIKAHFKKRIYIPLIKEFHEPATALQNAPKSALWEALRSGRVTFNRGTFSGKFNASITKELKALGATWDRKEGAFKARLTDLPMETRNMISSTSAKFDEKIARIDAKLAQISPAEIAGSLKLESIFSKTLWKAEKDFQANVKNITVAPQISETAHRKIVDEWQTNMDLWINDFLEEEIFELRTNIKEAVFAGNRYESAISTIQKSYGVSANKAKFLARQETNLLVSTFHQARYQDAGIEEYTWHSVAGTPAHPVRPQHKALAEASKRGKIYRWDDPPVTSEPGQPERRNNPKQDFNCRCFAKPVVRFRK